MLLVVLALLGLHAIHAQGQVYRQTVSSWRVWRASRLTVPFLHSLIEGAHRYNRDAEYLVLLDAWSE